PSQAGDFRRLCWRFPHGEVAIRRPDGLSPGQAADFRKMRWRFPHGEVATCRPSDCCRAGLAISARGRARATVGSWSSRPTPSGPKRLKFLKQRCNGTATDSRASATPPRQNALMQSISQRLRELREATGLRQAELAARACLRAKRLSALELGS